MARAIKSKNLKFALRSDSGLGLGKIFPINLSRNILGRSVDAEVPLEDAKASRHHAAVDVQGGFHYLVDLGSTNGTYLNDLRLVDSKRLTLGDRIRIGKNTFVIELLDEAKRGVPKSWREPTTAIWRDVISPVNRVQETVMARISHEPSELIHRWPSLMQIQNVVDLKPWLMIVLGVALVLVAMSI